MNISTHSLNASAGSLRHQGESESILELQKILNDERSRSAQHKINYQKIKTELTTLQERYSELEEELQNCNEQRKHENDEYKRTSSQLNRRLNEASNEIEELKVNQVTEKRIEIIRLKIEEEYESVYQERFVSSRQELESIRNEMQTVKQENMFLKSELENQVQEKQRTIEEIKVRHDSELKLLKEDKSRLIAGTIESPTDASSSSLKELSKENGILKTQIKSLKNEINEHVNKLDQLKLNSDQEARLKSKQTSELTAIIKRMEIEEESIRKQLIEIQRESSNYGNELSQSRHRMQELERINRSLQNRTDELVQKAKVDLTQLRLESTKQRGDIERQKENQAAKIDELEYQLKLAGSRCGILEKQLKERDSELARREASIKEEEWSRIQKLEQEKLESDSKLEEAESKLREERNTVNGRMEKLENKLEEAEKHARESEKEAESTQRKLEAGTSELKKLKHTLGELKMKNLQTEAELDECYNKLAVAELGHEEKKQYENKVSMLQKELDDLRNEKRDIYEEKMQDWKQDRQRQQERIVELEGELANALEKCRQLQDEIKRKNKKHGTYFNKQKQKLHIAAAKLEKMSIENDLLKQNVPADEYQKLRRELKELKRKHQEYSAIITMQSSNMMNGDSNISQNGFGTDHETPNQQYMERSLDELKRRLQFLDDKQQEQLPEIVNLHSKESNPNVSSQPNYGPRGDS